MKKILLMLMFISSPAQSSDIWRPDFINFLMNSNSGVNTGISFGYILGINQTVKTLQEFEIINNDVCTHDNVSSLELRDAINRIDYRDFDNDANGGAAYVYVSLLTSFPCQK